MLGTIALHSMTQICILHLQKCVVCVKDIDFMHPSSSKRLKASRQLQLMPLSQSEQMQALAKLKKILPNAPLFMRQDLDTDAAPLVVESHQHDPAPCQGPATWGKMVTPVLWQGLQAAIVVHSILNYVQLAYVW